MAVGLHQHLVVKSDYCESLDCLYVIHYEPGLFVNL